MSDSEKVVAELRRIAKVGFGYDINDHDRRALRSAADLIAKQAATIAARDDELIGERWHADEAARQRDVVKAALTAAEAEKESAHAILRDFVASLNIRGKMISASHDDLFALEARARAALSEKEQGA